jgi:hypothetical protein
MTAHPRDALKAWFLGPQAENAELLERLVVESLRDHVFWRRNYHPEDGVAIREIDKRQEGYEEAVGALTQGLMGLLAELSPLVDRPAGRQHRNDLGGVGRTVARRMLQEAADDLGAADVLSVHAGSPVGVVG